MSFGPLSYVVLKIVTSNHMEVVPQFSPISLHFNLAHAGTDPDVNINKMWLRFMCFVLKESETSMGCVNK